MNVRVVVTRPDGSPLQGAKVEILSTATKKRIGSVLTTDHGGSVVASAVTGPFFPKVRVTGDDHRVLVTGFGNYMNADYVLDSNGFGTHTTLASVIADAVASGVSKSIWVCTTHSETIASQISVGALAADQVITISSLGRGRVSLGVGNLAGAALIRFTETSPATASFVLDRLVLYKSAGSDPLYEAASGKTIPNLELHQVGFLGTNVFTYVVDFANSNTAVPRKLVLDGCWGTRLQNVHRLTFNTPAATDAFIMRNCDLTLVNIATRSSNSAPDWGGANSNDAGALITSNKLILSGYAWQKTYDCPLVFTGNVVLHTGAMSLLVVGNAASTTVAKNADISGNEYFGQTAGCNFLTLLNTTGPAVNVSCVGNALYGPGSGTAIATVASAGCSFEPNSFYGWGTNIGGAGHTDFYGAVTIAGTFAATISHASLTNLLRPADDHTQYALLLGRGTPVGNVFTGYASWGTGTAGYSSVIAGFTPGGYWRMGEASGNLADSSGNGNTATQVGAGQTYGVAGAIVGDTNKAITFPGINTSYYTIANNASIDVADTFTIIWWIKKAVNNTAMSIVSRATNGYEMRMHSDNKLMVLKCFVAAIVSSTTTITDTNWHMVGWTKSGATNKIYIDGADVTGAVSNQTIVATGGATTVGRNGQDGSLPWNGSQDEGVIIKGTALTAANMSAIYTASQGAPVPANLGDGDVTIGRILIGLDQAFTTDTIFLLSHTAVPTTGSNAKMQIIYNSNSPAGAASDEVMTANYQMGIHPTAASAMRHIGFRTTVAHDSGAFDLSNSRGLIGFHSEVQQNVGATTVTEMLGARILYRPIAGATTTAVGLEITRGVAGDAGTITTGIGILIGASAGVTPGTADIAIQSLGGTHRFVGGVKIGANADPTAGFELDVSGATGGIIVGDATPGDAFALFKFNTSRAWQFQTDGADGAGQKLALMSLNDSKAFYVGRTTAIKTLEIVAGTGAGGTGSIGFFNTAPAAKTAVADLVNNITAGGTAGQLDNFTDLVTYPNDAAAIRNDIYQLAVKVQALLDALQSYGLV